MESHISLTRIIQVVSSKEYWKKKVLGDISIYMFIFGLRKDTNRDGANLSFLLHLSTSPGVMKRIPFTLLYTFIIGMPSERWKVLSGVSYDRFGSALETLPRFLLNIQPKRVEERKLYAKIVSTLNLFFFSVHLSSPCVLYWFWYYRYHSSDDDVFSPPSPSHFHLCVLRSKSILS